MKPSQGHVQPKTKNPCLHKTLPRLIELSQSSAVQCSAVQCSAVQCSEAKRSVVCSSAHSDICQSAGNSAYSDGQFRIITSNSL